MNQFKKFILFFCRMMTSAHRLRWLVAEAAGMMVLHMLLDWKMDWSLQRGATGLEDSISCSLSWDIAWAQATFGDSLTYAITMEEVSN